MKPTIKSLLRMAPIPAIVLIVGLVMAQPAFASNTQPQEWVQAHVISGQVTGVVGGNVTLTYTVNNLAQQVVTNDQGYYTILVPDVWLGGTVTPSMPGYTFSPTSITYNLASASDPDPSGQNYVATAFIPTRTRTPTPTTYKTPTVTPTTPSGFSKVYPWNGTTKISVPSVTLSWRAYTGKFEKYRYCYDTINDSTCTGNPGWTSVSKGSTSVTVNLAVNTTYYWHVQAVICSTCSPKDFDDTNSGTWWSFSTGSKATETPTQTPIATATRTRTPTRTPTPTATPLSLGVDSNGADDGWILESGKNTGVGGSLNSTNTTIQLGDSAGKRQFRAILSFDTAALPDTARVTSAVLKIKQAGAVGTNPFSVLGKLWADIRNGAFGADETLEVADFKGGASAARVGSFGSTPVNNWYTATLTAAGRNNINTTGLTQFRLYFATVTNGDSLANIIKLWSGDAGTGKPQLVIRYSIP